MTFIGRLPDTTLGEISQFLDPESLTSFLLSGKVIQTGLGKEECSGKLLRTGKEAIVGRLLRLALKNRREDAPLSIPRMIPLLNLGNIRSLDVAGCTLTANVVDQLKSSFPKLTKEAQQVLEWQGPESDENRWANSLLSGILAEYTGGPFVLPLELDYIAKERVHKLDFSGLPLTTDILAQLAPLFPNLISLNLSSCIWLTDESLSALSMFPHLQELKLYLTNIVGIGLKYLPPSITSITLTCCKQLKEEHLWALGRCSKLRMIDLSRTPITGACFAVFPTSLESLTLAGNDFLKNSEMTHLSRFTQLQHICLYGLTISGDLLGVVSRSIKTVDLMGCKNIRDEHISQLKTCYRLAVLKITISNITGDCFKNLPPSIEIVESGGSIKECSLSQLQIYPNLTQVKIMGASITGTCFNALPPNIQTLIAYSCHCLKAKHLRQLKKYEKLEQLSLTYSTITTAGSIQDFHDLLPKKKGLTIELKGAFLKKPETSLDKLFKKLKFK